VKSTVSPALQSSRNLQKHTNLNPIHRWLLKRFHRKVAALLSEALADLQSRDTSYSLFALDAGCGEGFAETYLAQHVQNIRLVGLDFRPEAVAYAREQNAPLGQWLVGDVAKLPIRERAVPVVMCLEVLEHLPDPWGALQELSRVSSGYLLLSVPSQPFFALANLMRGKNLRTLGDDPEHLSHWTARTFKKLLERHVDVLKVEHSFPWVIVLAASTTRDGRQ